MQLTPKEILSRLGPLSPPGYPMIGISLYVIMGLTLITMFLQQKSNLTITIILSIAIMCGLVDKVATAPNAGAVFTQQSFGAFIIRIVMFIAPLFVAGMTKSPKSRGPAVVASVFAFAYTFMRWFLEMR